MNKLVDNILWNLAKFQDRIMGGGKNAVNRHIVKKGIVIGSDFRTSTNIRTAEPYLIEIGNNVTISHDVDFITHDNSVCKIFGVDNDLYGCIRIGDNCFIGAHAILMYGITIADNVIVATSSVVTKSIVEEGVIVAGNPARIVGRWADFKKKTSNSIIYTGNLSELEKKVKVLNNQDRFVKR